MLQDKLKKIVAKSPAVQATRKALSESGFVRIKGIAGSLKSLLLVNLFENLSSQIVYVCSELEEAETVKEDVEIFLGQEHVAFFPAGFSHSSGLVSTHQSLKSARLAALEALVGTQRLVTIVQSEGLLLHLPSPESFSKTKVGFARGDELDFETAITDLIDLGFVREPLVENPGEIAVRGGIIDVFPNSSDWPVRIEFWGDTIESIRTFDPFSQRSKDEIKRLTLYAQEFGSVADADETRSANVLDYLDKNGVVILDEPELIRRDLETQDAESDLAGAWDEIEHKINKFKQIRVETFGLPGNGIIDFDAKNQEVFRGNLKVFRNQINTIDNKILSEAKSPTQIFFVCDNKHQTERMRDIFQEEDIGFANFSVATLGIHKGFIFPEANLVVFTDHQFFGRSKQFRLRRSFKGLSLRQLRALNIGDLIVHEDFGIGLFKGLQKIKVRENERECLHLEYRDGDKVYVPIERMDRVQKYSIQNGMQPQLSKLGSPEWQRLKHRTKKKIKDIANELIEVYAKRKAQPGYAFSEDTLWERELEASFPYEDTPDQMKATIAVKRDMGSSKPMDRLVCGDVGFGKTEVAVRAAFKAVLSGKQVGMLVPTTILAYQHYTTFRDRLANFPVQVEMLSRFRTKSEQKKIVEQLKNGQLDIVIGTHRLLSRDLEFRDLGLLIIDEEQRFGVRHKEKLKRLRATIDVLTLTATPIPRTLHMALMGARDITNINTPPKNRLPIVTEVLPFNKAIIREAILKELGRGGQIFYVHNRVRSIEQKAAMLHKLIPEAKIGIAHGQMHEHDLEQVMIDFMQKKFDILVSTMIIESGLDIPNVNTIIVNRADKMGLAQLYQLRGRVGRSHQRAYAYLLIPPVETLNQDALKRLKAIEELTELGSGSQLAMRDLEIRGAGNLLGVEQSGYINAVGFELYNKLLDEAVRELRKEKVPEEELLPEIETQVDIQDDAYLPESYVQIDAQRVDIYRRLSEAKQLEELERMKSELTDRYGRLPAPVKNLFYFVVFRILGGKLGMKRIKVIRNQMTVEFAPQIYEKKGEHFNEWLGSIVSNAAEPIEFYQNNGFGLRVKLDSDDELNYDVASRFLVNLLNGKWHQQTRPELEPIKEV